MDSEATSPQRHLQRNRDSCVAHKVSDWNRCAGAQFPTDEAITQIVLRDPGDHAGDFREARHEQQGPGGGDAGDAGGIAVPLVAGNALVATAVDDQAEPIADVEVTEPGDVALQKASSRCDIDGLGAGFLDGPTKQVDADHLPAVPG